MLHPPEEIDCAYKIQCARAHLMNDMAQSSSISVRQKTSSLSLSVLTENCFRKFNYKTLRDFLWLELLELHSFPEPRYFYFIIYFFNLGCNLAIKSGISKLNKRSFITSNVYTCLICLKLQSFIYEANSILSFLSQSSIYFLN